MPQGKRDFFDVARDLFKKIPDWIKWLISLVTAVAGFIQLWRGDAGLVTIVLLAVGVGGGMLGCAYVAFKRDPPRFGNTGPPKYEKRWRCLALAGLIVLPLLTASGIGYHLFQQAQPPDKIIILVADFEGPDLQNYRVTETILARLRQALEPYDDVKVEVLGGTITEAEGSAVARLPLLLHTNPR